VSYRSELKAATSRNKIWQHLLVVELCLFYLLITVLKFISGS